MVAGKFDDPQVATILSAFRLLTRHASADSLATALTAYFFYHYPVSLAELNKEVRTAFSNLENLCLGPSLSSCRYLTAVLDKAMRFSPSIGGLMPREVLPDGLEIEGRHFPAGTVIGTPYHNDVFYPEPFAFKPSRWIEASHTTDASLQLAQSAFRPFSIGPRSCVGRTMAYAEMKVLLVRMTWLYDMRLKEGSSLGEGHPALGPGRARKDEFQLYDWFAARVNGPMLEFKRRPETYSPVETAWWRTPLSLSHTSIL